MHITKQATIHRQTALNFYFYFLFLQNLFFTPIFYTKPQCASEFRAGVFSFHCWNWRPKDSKGTQKEKKAMCMFSSLLFNQTFYSTEQAIISKIPIHTTNKKPIFHLMHMLYKPWHQHVNDTVIYIIHVSFEKRVTNFPVYLKKQKTKKQILLQFQNQVCTQCECVHTLCKIISLMP